MRRAILMVALSRSGLGALAMGKQVKFTVSREALETALRDFHLSYAPAMQQWSLLERSLCDWFQHASAMQYTMANAIFYSARGFTARIEMLEAAIEHSTALTLFQTEFLKEAAKKARQFTGFRNKVTHGQPVPHYVAGNPPQVFYTIAQRGDVSEPAELLSVEDLRLGTARIYQLHICIREMHPWLRARNPNLPSPEECLARVRALPTEPTDKSAHSGVEPAPQPREPVHRNKKEWRAAQQARKADSPPEGK
jgi:hypothetical protein